MLDITDITYRRSLEILPKEPKRDTWGTKKNEANIYPKRPKKANSIKIFETNHNNKPFMENLR